jgi:hypothetical protein
MPIVTGDGDFTSDVCRALGLDPGTTTSLTIRFRPGALVTVIAGHLLVDTQAGELQTVFKRYQLALQELE